MSLDDDNPPEKNAEVGYRKPPIHSRFRKGHSGNPKGRLRHDDPERVSSLFWREAGRLLTIREGDKTTKMPALRAVVRSQVASAVKGNVAAQRALVATARELARDSQSMSIEKLMQLRDQIDSTLGTKISEERRNLEAQLGKLSHFGNGGSRVKIRGGIRGKVAPKYRNPQNPSETWAGRGLRPRWLVAALKRGKKLDHFLVEGKASAAKSQGGTRRALKGSTPRRGRASMRGKSIAPKYRNPENPSETWAGRGLKPRWLTAAMKAGKELEHFAIAALTKKASS